MPQDRRQQLAIGISPLQRSIETIGIIGCFGLIFFIVVRIFLHLNLGGWWTLLSILAGVLAADFISGLVHWMGDTWGKYDTPLVGRAFIRPFREHHVDPLAITRHDFIEINGSNCMAVFIVLLLTWLAIPQLDSALAFHLTTFMVTLGAFIILTNQIHKWAHARSRPMAVTHIQNLGLILSPTHHTIHHASPYAKYYCITGGWWNPILTRTNFYRHTEKIISTLTGAEPRKDDLS